MKKLVKISLNSATRKCVADSNFLGFEGENQANTLVFSFTDGFIDGTAVLNIKRGKDIGFVEVDKMQKTYELPVRSSLLAQIGDVEFQFVLNKADGTIIKFDSFIMTVEDAIDTDAPLPEEYPSWVEMANTKLSEVDVALENTIKATANANQVANELIFAKQNGDFDGRDGVDGANGVSPTFQTVQVEGGARITITDADGIKEVFLKDGPQGATGPQGEVGPRGERGATGLTGPQGPKGEVGATGLQGLRGPQGPQGPQGEKGADGTVAFDQLTEAQKASLKGEKGDKGDKGDKGEQGPRGERGYAGNDGYSPIAIVEQTTTGAKITITDKNGTTTATVNHGKDGEGGSGGITTETDPLYTADKPNIALKSEIPTKTSELTNDSGFVTNTDYASTSTAGVIKIGANYGLGINTSGMLYPVKATNNDIDGKSNNFKVITPSNLDYAIKKALADSKLDGTNNAWTEEEKANARTLLGVDSGGGSNITIDTAMSDTSENAVQNKVIKAYVDGLVGDIETLLSEV